MACCAIAVFLLGQLYVAVAGLRQVLFGTQAAAFSSGGAADWRLDAPTMELAGGLSNRTGIRLSRRRKLFIAGTGSLAALAFALMATGSGQQLLFMLQNPMAFCEHIGVFRAVEIFFQDILTP